MSTWEIVRQQVVVSGIVSNKGGSPVRGASISATGARTGLPSYTSTTAADGTYYFTDLPDGAYSVTATASGSKVQGKIKVQRDKEGNVSVARLDLTIPT